MPASRYRKIFDSISYGGGIRRDVQRGLGKQPERDDAKDDTKEQAVIAAESRRLSNYYIGFSGCR